jgi:hypothetical protein
MIFDFITMIEYIAQDAILAFATAWKHRRRDNKTSIKNPTLPGEIDFTMHTWWDFTNGSCWDPKAIPDHAATMIAKHNYDAATALVALYYHMRAAGRLAPKTTDLTIARLVNQIMQENAKCKCKTTNTKHKDSSTKTPQTQRPKSPTGLWVSPEKQAKSPNF